MNIVAFSHFIHITDIWLDHLDDAIKLFLEGYPAKKHKEIIGGEQRKDSWSAMQFIYEHTIGKGMKMSCIQTAKITCATGMTEYLYENHEKAANMAMKIKCDLHGCNCPVLLDMVQDLHRASIKGIQRKDFKIVSNNVKSVNKIKRKPSSNMDVIKKLALDAGKRKNAPSGGTRLPQLTEEGTKKKLSFGHDGYITRKPVANNDTLCLLKGKGRGV